MKLARYGTDCYAYCMIASGQIDLVVEAGLNAYDVAALIPIVRDAGGIMTDWQGKPVDQLHPGNGQILAAGSATVHAEAMELLNRLMTNRLVVVRAILPFVALPQMTA